MDSNTTLSFHHEGIVYLHIYIYENIGDTMFRHTALGLCFLHCFMSVYLLWLQGPGGHFVTRHHQPNFHRCSCALRREWKEIIWLNILTLGGDPCLCHGRGRRNFPCQSLLPDSGKLDMSNKKQKCLVWTEEKFPFRFCVCLCWDIN